MMKRIKSFPDSNRRHHRFTGNQIIIQIIIQILIKNSEKNVVKTRCFFLYPREQITVTFSKCHGIKPVYMFLNIFGLSFWHHKRSLSINSLFARLLLKSHG